MSGLLIFYMIDLLWLYTLLYNKAFGNKHCYSENNVFTSLDILSFKLLWKYPF